MNFQAALNTHISLQVNQALSKIYCESLRQGQVQFRAT